MREVKIRIKTSNTQFKNDLMSDPALGGGVGKYINEIYLENILSYLPNLSARAGYGHKVNFKAEFNRFEFRIFHLLD